MVSGGDLQQLIQLRINLQRDNGHPLPPCSGPAWPRTRLPLSCSRRCTLVNQSRRPLPLLLTSGASLGKTTNKRLPAKTLWAHDQAMSETACGRLRRPSLCVLLCKCSQIKESRTSVDDPNTAQRLSAVTGSGNSLIRWAEQAATQAVSWHIRISRSCARFCAEGEAECLTNRMTC